VLVLGLNRATRLLGHLMLTEKAYDATILLGATTTTDDAEGEVTATYDIDGLTDEAIREALTAFVGEIDQVPTAVSAIKVDGKRAYQRVRDGEEVELKARRVTIHELTVTDVRGPEVDVSVRCSSGTYIRAIARDLGAALGVGGHLTALRRTAVGRFDLAQAKTLAQLGEELALVPIADAARATFPAVELDDEQAADVRVGRPLSLALPGAGEHALFAPDGEFLALYEPTETGARPVAVFVG
jgi:tRNA pseudouridine55 synthase